jgi:hypothetical protein
MVGVTFAAAGFQGAAPDPWQDFLGTWQGEGRFLGADARAELSWERVLNQRFVRLTQRITVRRAEAEQTFEGHAYYAARAEGSGAGTWFDVEGHVYAITATLTDNMLDARWGPAGAPRGHTVYQLTDGALSVVDSAPGRDGTWFEFGRLSYRRIR